MLFWTVAAVLVVIASLATLWPLVSRRGETTPREAFDIQVYKDQLKEIDNDVARGVLSESEAQSSRTEISRRLLAAASTGEPAPKAQSNGKATSYVAAAVTFVAIIVGGFGLYQYFGTPGYSDQPLATRGGESMSQLEAEQAYAERNSSEFVALEAARDPEHVALVEQLASILETRPDDLTGHRMLMENLAQLGFYARARAAQEDVLRILGDEAAASDYSQLAELMVLAADFYVSPEAAVALSNALERDPLDPLARYYAGVYMLQVGNLAQAYEFWNSLLVAGPQDAPWIPLIEAEIDGIAEAAGITPTRGPSAEDIAAASEMSADEQAEMIEGMVAQLMTRLAEEGGSADEWARLINALGVLGDTERAAAIWEEAQTTFASDAEALVRIRNAAIAAGVAE